MGNPTSRRPILKKNVEAFVPSPRFLSESPARQPSSGKPTPTQISRPGQPQLFSPSPSQQLLRSPVPPPPANLFRGNASVFNVDPAMPFLATAGASDVGNSVRGSVDENESPKRFVGGFVTGLKRVLTFKGSQRQSFKHSRAGEEMYSPPTIVRDSGYADSDRFEEPPPNQPPPTIFSPPPPPSPRDLISAMSEPPPVAIYQNDAPTAAPDDILSPDSLASVVSAHPEYGPDYAKMDRPTPPHSDVSLNTYMARIQNFIHDLVALPWIADERVTVDYYPTSTERRDKRLSHRPAIIWRSQDYNDADYHLDSDSESSSLKKTPYLRVRAPSHTSRIDINLDSEFPGETHSPLPYHPPNTVQTPDQTRVHPEGVRSGEVKSPLLNASKSPIPTSSLQQQPNAVQTIVPNLGNASTQLPDTLPLFPPNTRQTPEVSQAYVEDLRSGAEPLPLLPPNTSRTRDNSQFYSQGLRPRSRSDAKPALLKALTTRNPDLHSVPTSPPINGRARSRSRTQGDDPRLMSRNHTTTPTRHRLASVQPMHSATPGPMPKIISSNQSPRPGSSRQSTPGSSPSRRSHRSHHSSSRGLRHEGTEEWESFPQDRPGYVPFEYSENYYGTRYGVGIHGLLPPVARSAASTAPSIKQPKPQYPKSALVTPPSRTSSSS